MNRKELVSSLRYALPMEPGEVADAEAMADVLLKLLPAKEPPPQSHCIAMRKPGREVISLPMPTETAVDLAGELRDILGPGWTVATELWELPPDDAKER